MAKTILKSLGAVIAGLVTGAIVIFAVEQLSGRLFPPPAGLDFHDREAVRAFIAAMPLGAFALILGSYAFGSATGGAVATLIGSRQRPRAALIVGALLTVGGILNLLELPHPLWFAIVSTLVYVPCAWVGFVLLKRAPATA
jgi:hypothetical protein